MNLWNMMYLTFAVAMVYLMPAPGGLLVGFCILPVVLLWLARWVGNGLRSRAVAAAMAGSACVAVPDTGALAITLRGLGYPLRDWLMRGYPTGATQYWVRDAWRLGAHGMDCTAMEVQSTPGYVGMGVPVWRVRHGALLVQRTQAWPDFEIWRNPSAKAASTHGAAAPLRTRPAGRGQSVLAIEGFLVKAALPEQAWAQFAAAWLALAQAPGADFMAMARGTDLVIFWRKQPFDGAQMLQLLQHCAMVRPAPGP